jgi:hypothetical protein
MIIIRAFNHDAEYVGNKTRRRVKVVPDHEKGPAESRA